MFAWLNKIVYNEGYNTGKLVIDSSLNRQISDLKLELSTVKTHNNLLQEQISELLKNFSNEKIKLLKESEKRYNDIIEEKIQLIKKNEFELHDIKTEYNKKTEKANDTIKIYDEKLKQLKASELYIRNHLETRSQIDMTAICRMELDIEKIESDLKSELKKI